VHPWLPRSLRWGILASFVVHATILGVLAIWTYRIARPAAVTIDTILGGVSGSTAGSEHGDQLRGGLGLDEPLGLPDVEAQPVIEAVPAALLPVPAPPVVPTEIARAAPPAGAAIPRGAAPSGPGQAGLGDGFGAARFGSGTERIQGIEVKVGDPQFTLIWEGRGDVDLHVIEPGGSEIWGYKSNHHGDQGGELDVDNRTGPGPENIYWAPDHRPSGLFRWFVQYYGPAPFEPYAGPVRWRVRIKHQGKVSEYRGVLGQFGDRSRTYTLAVDGKAGGA
jgi:hypothetical protein